MEWLKQPSAHRVCCLGTAEEPAQRGPCPQEEFATRGARLCARGPFGRNKVLLLHRAEECRYSTQQFGHAHLRERERDSSPAEVGRCPRRRLDSCLFRESPAVPAHPTAEYRDS